jgi:dTDP-glucose pyrophosphorylase
MGSRYGGLKQLDPVGPNQETIIDYSVFDATRAGFDKLVFVIRRDIEADFKEAVGRRFETRVEVRYVFQELGALPAGFTVPSRRQKPWGTAHAILAAAESVEEPFVVINADDFYGEESYRLLSGQLDRQDGNAAMAGFVLRNTLSEFGAVARGLCDVSEDGFLRGVTEVVGIEKNGEGARFVDEAGEAHRLTGDEAVSMNMWGFNPDLFGHLERHFTNFLRAEGEAPKSEFYIPTVVNRLIQEGHSRVRVLPTGAAWFGVTYREDRSRVIAGIRQLIDQGHYPEQLWQ